MRMHLLMVMALSCAMFVTNQASESSTVVNDPVATEVSGILTPPTKPTRLMQNATTFYEYEKVILV